LLGARAKPHQQVVASWRQHRADGAQLPRRPQHGAEGEGGALTRRISAEFGEVDREMRE